MNDNPPVPQASTVGWHGRGEQLVHKVHARMAAAAHQVRAAAHMLACVDDAWPMAYVRTDDDVRQEHWRAQGWTVGCLPAQELACSAPASRRQRMR